MTKLSVRSHLPDFLLCAAMALAGLLAAFPAHAQTPEPFQTVERPTPAFARGAEITAETTRLLKASDTSGLEAEADRLRRSGESFDSGRWMLSAFYAAAVVVPRKDPVREREAMEFYERWAKERPESITAQVCLASALTDHAWNARGGGYANTVSEDGWRLFDERLERAYEVLDAASSLSENCPEWFSAMQTIALGQGWERKDYLEMVEEAIRRTPTYGQYYTNACYWLFPRWHGETGDFEKWIAAQADKYPPGQRDLEYARFVWSADRMRMEEEMVFAPQRLDWERTRRGFEEWLRAEPGNLVVLTEYARLATLADDRETARQVFEQLGGKFIPGLWDNKPGVFRAARKYAREQGANPLLAPSRPAKPALSPAQLERVSSIFKLSSHFVGGLLAGMLLFFLALQRRQIWAGVIALLACLVAGTAFGTAATIPLGAGLWLHLRRVDRPEPPERDATSGWLVLLWVLLLAGIYLGLQVAATIPAMMPFFLAQGADAASEATRRLFSDGTAMQIALNAGWLTFLALVLICRPHTPAGWRARLGLQPCAPWPAVWWTLGMAVFIVGLGLATEPFMDERTREAAKLLAAAVHSPVLLVLAVVLMAPVVEELIFRGYAFSAWLPKLGLWGASLLTAGMFSALHLQYGWVGLLHIFIMGLALAFLRWKTGSVYPCIALHLINNLTFTVGLFLNGA